MSAERLRYGRKRVARRLTLAVLGAALLVAALPASLSTGAGAAVSTSESANPINDQGANYHYRSNITAVTPNVHGLGLQVLEFADRMLLVNHTGQTVTVLGYQGEPYARVLANGTAEQNVRSPATYLNTNFYADVTVPPVANPTAPPRWEVLDRTGQLEWHDHRIHWMSPLPPPQVKDRSRLTLVFDWRVPIEVGTRKGAIDGQLFWTPASSRAPVAAIVLGALIIVAGLLFVLFVRRRRAGGSPTGASSSGGPAPASKDAW